MPRIGDDARGCLDETERTQVPVIDLRQVVPDRELVREVRDRAPLRRRSRDEMVDLARDRLLEKLIHDLGPVVRCVVAIAAECIEGEPMRVVARRRIRDVVLRVRRVPAEEQVGHWREGEVAADHLLVLVVVRKHAVHVARRRRREVPQSVTTAGDGRGIAVLVAVAQPRIDEQVAGRATRAGHADHRQASEPIREAVAIRRHRARAGAGDDGGASKDRVARRSRARIRSELQRVRKALIRFEGPLGTA